MQRVVSAAEMREIDRLTTERYSTPSLLLMEAAASAVLNAIATRFSGNLAGKRARVLCGPGNNGGDGAALARALWRAGARADVVLFGRVESAKGVARTNFEMLRRLASFEAGSNTSPPPVNFSECESLAAWEEIARPLHRYDIIVDALLGTGVTRPLEGLLLKVLEHLEVLRDARSRSDLKDPLIVSVDIPSGLDADSAQPIGGAVHADLTVTFTAPKPANVLPPASHYNGELIIANIGSPPALLEAQQNQLLVVEDGDARQWLIQTRYTPESYKNTHGHALIIAGSRHLTGAAILCGNAAMSAGAGLVTVATAASAQPSLAARAMPETMTAALAETEKGAVSIEALEDIDNLRATPSVVAIGPGLTSDDARTRSFVHTMVERRNTPIVIDADGLNCLAPWPKGLRGSTARPVILTPHAGEMLRLMGAENKEALKDRVSVARDFATAHSVILVLKGSRSLIAAPDGRVFINPTGNAGLGTAGAGDTLTGIIAGFNAQDVATLKERTDALSATIAAVYVSGLSGDIAAREGGMRTMVASDIREHLGAAVRALDPLGEAP
jgi:hydroxyethylthiazole kinase-like uncharacterized protein yjeF